MEGEDTGRRLLQSFQSARLLQPRASSSPTLLAEGPWDDMDSWNDERFLGEQPGEMETVFHITSKEKLASLVDHLQEELQAERSRAQTKLQRPRSPVEPIALVRARTRRRSAPGPSTQIFQARLSSVFTHHAPSPVVIQMQTPKRASAQSFRRLAIVSMVSLILTGLLALALYALG